MTANTIIVSSRFCGPPNSANGGYIAGRLASYIGHSAVVTLRHPPPLDTPLRAHACENGGVELYDKDRLIAFADSADAVAGEFPVVDFKKASAASQRTFPAASHAVPGCFVCGPARTPGDGLRIHAGPLDSGAAAWQGVLAAPWVPSPDLADDDGVVSSEFVWAALDCPTAYACSTAEGMPPILLGRQTLSVHRRPAAEERCIILARHARKDGRKHYADAALLDANGRRLADCNAIWIEVTEEQLNANA